MAPDASSPVRIAPGSWHYVAQELGRLPWFALLDLRALFLRERLLMMSPLPFAGARVGSAVLRSSPQDPTSARSARTDAVAGWKY